MGFDTINKLAKDGVPFLVIVDFKAETTKIIKLAELHEQDIEFSINETKTSSLNKIQLEKNPLSFKQYKKKFDSVIEKIKSGETYLLNLTQSTPIKTDLSLKEIFASSGAKYKLRYKNQFVCFSPEQFVSISNNKINTFPMKGTIDANIKNASEEILNNKKEMAEHVMVVDLLRNDLSMVSRNVKVEKFRYITEIEAGDKNLLQVSSHISGELRDDWQSRLGNILRILLPAGSISGTPKRSTLEIIDEIEGYDRGFYSGIFGVFDGENFDSGVMIRFIENTKDGYFYKSGGGITLDSDDKDEYKELLDKIYLA